MIEKWTTILQIARLCGWVTALRVVWARASGGKEVRLPLPTESRSVLCRLNNSDLVIFIGTFLHGDSLVSMAPKPALILDLGANAGFTAIQLKSQFPDANIIMVEPGRDNCRVCAENTAVYEDAVLVCAVMSHQEGWFQVTDPDDIAMSQWYEKCTREVDGALPSMRIAELLDVYGGGRRPVLVKMDIEEAEREIFLHDTQWLSNVDAVLVEPHGVGTKEIIEKTFCSYGFDVDLVGEKILGHRESIEICAVSR